MSATGLSLLTQRPLFPGATLDLDLYIHDQVDAVTPDAMVVRVVKEGVSTEYRISKDLKSDTDKECQFLRVGESQQSYCASKSSISALQNILP